MIRKSITIGMMCISLVGFSQVQCEGKTKKNVQCKQITKSSSKLCHHHDPNHKKKEVYPTVICSGKTKKNLPCKNKTADISGKCHNHRKK
tara:strand:- start:384 stop:653 length:270 start_codon:yes stop_codon:yes gene_type:complete